MVRLDGPCEPGGWRPAPPATGSERTRTSPSCEGAIAGYADRPRTCSTNTASVIQQSAKGAFDCRER